MTQSLVEKVFASRSAFAVLRCLHDSPGALTGREIARRAGFSPQQAHVVLKGLVSSGVAGVEVAAPAHLYRLNRKHWLITEVADIIFCKEKEWLERLLREVSEKLPPAVSSLILFGSAARAGLHAGSDIDLLALVSHAADKKEALAYFTGRSAAILERYHFPLAPIILTLEEFRAQYRAKNDFARTVLRTGRVVRGKLLTEIL